jgi:hypothetical protein
MKLGPLDQAHHTWTYENLSKDLAAQDPLVDLLCLGEITNLTMGEIGMKDPEGPLEHQM